MSTTAPAPFRELIDLSFEEAAFLWRRWESELTSLTRNLDEVVSWTEDRLHGALDGVRVAGADLVDIATKELASKDSDRATVAAGLLASCSEQAAVDALANTLRDAEGATLAVVLRGLELFGNSQTLRAAAAVLASSGPPGAAALCRLKVFRRSAPGDELLTAFNSNLAEAQVQSLRTAAAVPLPQGDKVIAAALDHDEPSVRLAAVESGVSRGLPRARDMAIACANRLDESAVPYLKLIAMFGTANDHELVFAALRIPALQKHAIWALGCIGTSRAAEACLAGMQYEKLARASGEAYCWITGAELSRDGLAKNEAVEDAPAFEDDNLDANLVPAPDALWPLPDLDAIQRHWTDRRAMFADHARHVHGRPANIETLISMVESGPMLRRPDAIFELRARTRGKYDVEPFAFAARQRQMMAASRAAVSSHHEP